MRGRRLARVRRLQNMQKVLLSQLARVSPEETVGSSSTSLTAFMRDDDVAAAEYLRWQGDDDLDEYCEGCANICCCGCGLFGLHRDQEESISPLQLFCCSRLGRFCQLLMLVVFVAFTYFLVQSSSSPSTTIQGFGEISPAKPETYNTARAIEVLSALCNAYSAGKVSGDSCSRLCYAHNWNVAEYHEGNKVVIVLKNGDQTPVFKSSHPFIEDFTPIDLSLEEDKFTDQVLYRVNDLLRLGWPLHYKRHLIETVWPSLLRTPGEPLSKADRRSLSALLDQEEFVTFRILPLTRVTPQIIGTCGHFYETETLVPFRMKAYYLNLKGKILVHLMGTLKLFYEFLNEPLQWCDVRFENLGLSADYPKRFVIMDGDKLYTHSRLDELFHAKPCATDDDCRIGDCKARCRADLTCSGRINEDLEVFCDKLIKPMFGSSWSRSNKYLVACYDVAHNTTSRLNDLLLTWAWTMSDL